MPIDVADKAPGDDLFAREVNAMTRAIDGLLGTKGPNTIADSSGVHQRRTTPSSGLVITIADVVSDATGGGHYNVQLQQRNDNVWESNTDPYSTDGSAQTVALNLVEAGATDIHNLDAGDRLIVWFSGSRLVGIPIFGRHTFGEVP